MATYRIVLLISDEEITSLTDTLDVLDEISSGYEANDYPEEVAKVNNLYFELNAIKERIEREVLAS